MSNHIEIYKTDDGFQISIVVEDDTVWATQRQMSQIFETTPQNITIHLKNVYQDGEIDEISTCKEYLQVQTEGGREVKRKQLVYNLDAILSVGYRVNSRRGTQFRQWATQRLKEYLIRGYSVNQKRLDELGKMVELIELSGKAEALQLQEARGLLEILSHYTKSFVLLNQYDSHSVQTGNLSVNITFEIQYDEARVAIAELKKQLISKKEATELFGNEKDGSFRSSLQSIVQTFGGQYLYPEY
jgi:hypothetical protein